MSDNANVVKHVVVTGRVQGVGFRIHTNRVAQQLGVTGWVRNRTDGTVEAMVAGRPDAVHKMIEWMRHGPRLAVVTDIKISEGDGIYAVFESRATQ